MGLSFVILLMKSWLNCQTKDLIRTSVHIDKFPLYIPG